MLIRHTRPADSPQIYEAFQAAQISAQDPRNDVAKNGFFDYRLGYQDLAARVNTPFSFVLEQDGRILSYILAYTLGQVNPQSADPVHHAIGRFDPGVVYLDQLFLESGCPLPLAARFLDTVDYVWRSERIPGVVTAIPEQPWKNVSSTRLALARGLTRRGIVERPTVTLGIYVKPYLPMDNPFEGMGDRLLQA